MRTRLTTALALSSILALGACSDTASLVSPDEASSDSLESLVPVTALAASSIWEGGYGAVFTSSNSPEGNEVLTFYRAPDGTLYPKEPVSTGGLGTGGGLGNQGALALNNDASLLLVVNAGSDDVSVMGTEGWPELLHRVPSQGTRPISVAVRGSLVYVLNGGGEENVAGFRLSRKGRLTPIRGAVYPLSEGQVASAQVGFSPDGRSLVVTEKATNRILIFPVMPNGRLGQVRVEESAGQTPFGFAFSRQGTLVVSEAFGGAPGASVLSSYGINGGGLMEITPLAATTQTAACWVVITRNGRYAYTTNTGSGTISSFSVSPSGELYLLEAVAAGMEGNGPIDMALSRNSRFLHVLNSGTNTLGAYKVRNDGSLERIEGASGLPSGANGLAAR